MDQLLDFVQTSSDESQQQKALVISEEGNDFRRVEPPLNPNLAWAV